MTLPSTMPAVVLNGKDDLTVEELPVPAPGPGEVLVEVSHCGVCGSDLHMVIDGWGRKGSVEGHEWSGTVVAVGDGVTTWTTGDHIVGVGSVRETGKRHPVALDLVLRVHQIIVEVLVIPRQVGALHRR